MGKIRNMHVKTPPIWKYNFSQECFFQLKKKDFCITEFAKNLFNKIFEKLGFWQSYLLLKYSFSVHFNGIITQFIKMLWKIVSFFLDSDGAKSKIKLPKCCFFSYHVSLTAWFLQGLTRNYTKSESNSLKNVSLTFSLFINNNDLQDNKKWTY